jgi:hypothetical protein
LTFLSSIPKAINLWPEFVFAHIGLKASYGLAGRMEAASAEALFCMTVCAGRIGKDN